MEYAEAFQPARRMACLAFAGARLLSADVSISYATAMQQLLKVRLAYNPDTVRCGVR